MSAVTNKPVLHLLEGREGKLRLMRFWSKVDIRSPDECWDWQASVNLKGYGRFKLASYTTVTAHRLALVATARKEPAGLCVLHSCDRPICCNPHHLRFGTVADNTADKVSRGRARNGSRSGFDNPACKLTPEQLAIIVTGIRAGKNNTEIANDLPVTHSLVSAIRRGKIWKDHPHA